MGVQIEFHQLRAHHTAQVITAGSTRSSPTNRCSTSIIVVTRRALCKPASIDAHADTGVEVLLSWPRLVDEPSVVSLLTDNEDDLHVVVRVVKPLYCVPQCSELRIKSCTKLII